MLQPKSFCITKRFLQIVGFTSAPGKTLDKYLNTKL